MTSRPNGGLPIIVRGNPTDEEIAAVVAILAAVAPTPAPDGPPRWERSRCWAPDTRPGEPRSAAWARTSADRAFGVLGNSELMPAYLSGNQDDLGLRIGATAGGCRRHDEPVSFSA